MAKRVTVSDDTMQKIEPLAKPFEKFDDCLKRVLECSCITKETKQPESKEDSKGD
jgi:hypothetical protein